jgi:hypothetical protein
MKPHQKLIACRPLITTGTLLLCAFITLGQIPKYNSHSQSSATVYLDFDGQVVKGTAWNWDSTIHARPANVSLSAMTEIFNRVAEDFRIFNINITTDSNVFKKAPASKRMRVIFTPTSKWYGDAAGVSYVNSFTWGDDTPAWVFTILLEGKPKYMAEAASHEIGHTLGLQHQSTYSKNCDLVAEYAEGKGNGEIGWAPIMGVGYYKNLTVWTVGTSIEGCSIIQNDISILSKNFAEVGFRADDHGNNKEKATNLILNDNNFQSAGIINNSSDRDFFKIVLPRRMRLKATAIPSNVGANNSGANVDIYLMLVNRYGDTVVRNNPRSLLSASLDSTLQAGTYYLAVDGVGNQNVSDYGSVGLYSLAGSIENIAAVPTVLLRGNIRDKYHIVQWDVRSDVGINKSYVEYSLDGSRYYAADSIPLFTTSFAYRAPSSQLMYYRVKVKMNDETEAYSNTITLATDARVTLKSTLVTNTAELNSDGVYAYQLLDISGRMLAKGNVTAGSNSIPLNAAHKGLVLLKVFDASQQFQFRLIQQ